MSISLIPFDSHIECMTIDTETTGLDPAGGDEILTLAMVLDIDGQDSPSTVHLRVMPQHKTEWPDAERVNHISPASVTGYKPFERYLEAVQFLFDRTEKIVGWNVNFDLGFLESEGVVIPQTTKGSRCDGGLRARIRPVFGDSYPMEADLCGRCRGL